MLWDITRVTRWLTGHPAPLVWKATLERSKVYFGKTGLRKSDSQEMKIAAVKARAGAVVINGGGQLIGTVVSNRLTINPGGL